MLCGRIFFAASTLCLCVAGEAWGQGAEEKPGDEGIAFFENRIRPVLAEHCYECHSLDAEEVKGGLLVDSREGIRRGGDSGPAVVPGDSGASLLLSAIMHSDPDLEMPPKKAKLPDSVIVDFDTWIGMGAHDPREAKADVADEEPVEKPPLDIASGRRFWSFLKPQRPTVPEAGSSSWPATDIDRFVLAKLKENGLVPSGDAAPAVLLRQLHFDLVGLPPSPEDQNRFLEMAEAGQLEAALEKEVDRLLDSSAFGERWGRHWMDVARFAESSGRESNLTFPHAWRWRDYVIDSFNADKPYDRFLTEQLAGDLLPYESEEERAELLIATGFLAFGPKGLNEMNRDQFFADLVDEQIDTVSRAIMAHSVACARCHDHKFAPYHMTDYYALAGVFASTETFYGTSVGSENNVGGDLITLPKIEGQFIPNKPIPLEKVEELKAKVEALNEEERAGKEAVAKAIKARKDPGDLFTLEDALRILWTRGGIEGQLETVDDAGNALPLAMGVLDKDKPVNVPILERGELENPGQTIRRGFPRVILLDGLKTPASHQSGRNELAEWLTHPEHPLTSRVMANRIWHWMIGAGIVRTTDNFEFTGERPSHPMLLDYLATEFVAGGWSVKSLVRKIALTRTYRQASDWNEENFERDPENRLLWRANKLRLEAECIRDAMLSVSGRLDASRRPGSLVAEIGDRSVSLFGFSKEIPPDLDGCEYRSVYLPVVRDRLPDVLELFDSAEPSLVTGERSTTNVPVQALYLLNSPFVREQAKGLADRAVKAADSPEGQVEAAYQLCFGRVPEAREIAASLRYFSNAGENGEAMVDFCQALLSTAEFRNLD